MKSNTIYKESCQSFLSKNNFCEQTARKDQHYGKTMKIIFALGSLAAILALSNGMYHAHCILCLNSGEPLFFGYFQLDIKI